MSLAIIGLTIAAISLVSSVGKIAFDIRVAPRREQSQSKRIRAEIRREAVASNLRGLLGLHGSLVVDAIESSWRQRDLQGLRDASDTMFRVAREAYRSSETINDIVEIHVGVIMVEAQEIVDAIDAFQSSPNSDSDFEDFDFDFDFAKVEDSINLVVERVTDVQNWTDKVLGKPISLDE
jgi:hypothetical protein